MSSKGGAGKKSYKLKQRATSSNPKIINANRNVDKKRTDLRDKATIKRLQMQKDKAVNDRDGKFLRGAYMARSTDQKVMRIEPNRKWFGPTRTVGQKELDKFRTEMGAAEANPYVAVVRTKKLPTGLLTDPFKGAKMNLLTTESFGAAFGPKRQRKKARLAGAVTDVSALATHITTQTDKFQAVLDDVAAARRANNTGDGLKEGAKPKLFQKGQSKRIWSELYKVIDSSDVVIQVLDVRDPLGTRSRRIEDELKKPDRRHKHLVFLLNKCDLVPTWVTRRWVKVLSAEYPTLAFHASITNPFGKGSLIALLRQFATIHKERRQISVGFVGYPNVGKSSVINTLRGKKVCEAAPIPGRTRVWRYITLFKRIFLIDCPGTVYSASISDIDCVLKGVVRIDKLPEPQEFVQAVLDRVKKEYLVRTYGIAEWKDSEEFLEQLAFKSGKLLRNAEPDISTAARMVLNDWQRGRVPYFVCPPFEDDLDRIAMVARTPSSAAPMIEQLFGKINCKLSFSKADQYPPTAPLPSLPLSRRNEDGYKETPAALFNNLSLPPAAEVEASEAAAIAAAKALDDEDKGKKDWDAELDNVEADDIDEEAEQTIARLQAEADAKAAAATSSHGDDDNDNDNDEDGDGDGDDTTTASASAEDDVTPVDENDDEPTAATPETKETKQPARARMSTTVAAVAKSTKASHKSNDNDNDDDGFDSDGDTPAATANDDGDDDDNGNGNGARTKKRRRGGKSKTATTQAAVVAAGGSRVGAPRNKPSSSSTKSSTRVRAPKSSASTASTPSSAAVPLLPASSKTLAAKKRKRVRKPTSTNDGE